ncbi:MAG TPA: hypothetical protein VNG12_20815 [Acidimicrobiales bacterium]|nr:hypothetical protein [Acidimicrobiales bacterium]
MPTVSWDEQSIRKAALRGARSLFARDMVILKGERLQAVEPLSSWIDCIVRERRALAVYLGSRDFSYLPQELTVAHYRGDDAFWLTEITTSGGLHFLGHSSPEQCQSAAGLLIDQVYSNGLADVAGPSDSNDHDSPLLCVWGATGEKRYRMIVTSLAQILAYQFEEPPDYGAPSPLSDAHEAVGFLLARS